MSGGAQSLPTGPLLTWYGDDFTGATAVMEVLAFAGLPSVLFLDVPTSDQLAVFSDRRAIGIAGIARSQPPEWMETHLPACFAALASIGAPVSHYKVCSTFDSSPEIGSIGRAIELAAPLLGGAWHPLVVGAPEIGRYQAFGNLFAAVEGEAFRLDRHPTMSRHPVTPMDEADVRRHLGRQTSLQSELVDIVSLMSGAGDGALAKAREAGGEIIALDVMDEVSLAEVGRLIWQHRGERLLTVGSQGVEYALVAHWRDQGLLPVQADRATVEPVDQLAVVSGSCSPITAGQVEWAAERGFSPIAIDASFAVSAPEWENELGRVLAIALTELGEGQTPLIFTAAGPEDPAIARFNSACERTGTPKSEANEAVGRGLGTVLSRLAQEANLGRGVIAGGDTSSHAAASLGLHALTALAPIAAGAPLCRGHSDDKKTDGFQIALKGGQMGPPDYFNLVKQGG